MEQLIKYPEMAGQLADYLKQQLADGFEWAVYDTDNPIYSIWDLQCFKSETDALDFEREYQQMFNWHEAVPISDLVYALEKIEYSLNDKDMNKNNLEDLKTTLRALKFDEKHITAMEQQMEKNVPEFKLHDQITGDKGQIDLTLNFRQSSKSDYYYFNNYTLAMSKAKPLDKDHKYLVFKETAPGQEPVKKEFESVILAMDYFKAQMGNYELAAGKFTNEDFAFRNTLATMKEGKVDYIAKEFYPTFRNPAITNTFYLKNGSTFNVNQGTNLIQGRAVFRDDLVSRAGEKYAAWNTIDFDQPKDFYGNYKIKQYSEGYGFDVKKELESYQIKELSTEKKTEELIAALKEGDRPVVTVAGKDGQDEKLRIVAMPKYSNINFFELNGKPVKREDHKKELAKENIFEKKLQQGKQKQKESSQELSI